MNCKGFYTVRPKTQRKVTFDQNRRSTWSKGQSDAIPKPKGKATLRWTPERVRNELPSAFVSKLKAENGFIAVFLVRLGSKNVIGTFSFGLKFSHVPTGVDKSFVCKSYWMREPSKAVDWVSRWRYLLYTKKYQLTFKNRLKYYL